jgi:hypothetical protein
MITINKIRTNSFEGMIEEPEVGENIITKIQRIMDEGEPIEDTAPLIYTPKKNGVEPQYDIRTDKWSIAMQAMDRVNAYKVSEWMKDDKVGDEKPEPEKEKGKEGEGSQKSNPVTDN